MLGLSTAVAYVPLYWPSGCTRGRRFPFGSGLGFRGSSWRCCCSSEWCRNPSFASSGSGAPKAALWPLQRPWLSFSCRPWVAGPSSRRSMSRAVRRATLLWQSCWADFSRGLSRRHHRRHLHSSREWTAALLAVELHAHLHRRALHAPAPKGTAVRTCGSSRSLSLWFPQVLSPRALLADAVPGTAGGPTLSAFAPLLAAFSAHCCQVFMAVV